MDVAPAMTDLAVIALVSARPHSACAVIMRTESTRADIRH